MPQPETVEGPAAQSSELENAWHARNEQGCSKVSRGGSLARHCGDRLLSAETKKPFYQMIRPPRLTPKRTDGGLSVMIVDVDRGPAVPDKSVK